MAYYPFLYEFKDSYTGSYKSFSKKKQTIIVRLSSQAPSGGNSSSFVVRLQKRVALVGYSTVGTATFPRNGLKEVKFSNLDAGSYRVRLEKSTDNIKVIGVGVLED